MVARSGLPWLSLAVLGDCVELVADLKATATAPKSTKIREGPSQSPTEVVKSVPRPKRERVAGLWPRTRARA
jgi:hypothetical protein